jgi:hypothetical protein
MTGERDQMRRDQMLTALQAGHIAWFPRPPLLSEILDLTGQLGLDPLAVTVIPGGGRMVGIKASGA